MWLFYTPQSPRRRFCKQVSVLEKVCKTRIPIRVKTFSHKTATVNNTNCKTLQNHIFQQEARHFRNPKLWPPWTGVSPPVRNWGKAKQNDRKNDGDRSISFPFKNTAHSKIFLRGWFRRNTCQQHFDRRHRAFSAASNIFVKVSRRHSAAVLLLFCGIQLSVNVSILMLIFSLPDLCTEMEFPKKGKLSAFGQRNKIERFFFSVSTGTWRQANIEKK